MKRYAFVTVRFDSFQTFCRAKEEDFVVDSLFTNLVESAAKKMGYTTEKEIDHAFHYWEDFVLVENTDEIVVIESDVDVHYGSCNK